MKKCLSTTFRLCKNALGALHLPPYLSSNARLTRKIFANGTFERSQKLTALSSSLGNSRIQFPNCVGSVILFSFSSKPQFSLPLNMFVQFKKKILFLKTSVLRDKKSNWTTKSKGVREFSGVDAENIQKHVRSRPRSQSNWNCNVRSGRSFLLDFSLSLSLTFTAAYVQTLALWTSARLCGRRLPRRFECRRVRMRWAKPPPATAGNGDEGVRENRNSAAVLRVNGRLRCERRRRWESASPGTMASQPNRRQTYFSAAIAIKLRFLFSLPTTLSFPVSLTAGIWRTPFHFSFPADKETAKTIIDFGERFRADSLLGNTILWAFFNYARSNKNAHSRLIECQRQHCDRSMRPA